MQNHSNPVPRIQLERPARRPSLLRRLATLGVLAASIGGGAWAWEQGYRPPWLGAKEAARVDLVEVDRGDIAQYVVEFGTVESASDTVVRCQVEALIGMVGGSNATGAGGRSGGTTSTTGAAQSAATTAQTQAATATTGTTAAKSATGTAATKAGATKSGSSTTGSGSSTGSSGSGSGGTSTAAAGATTSGKPTIRSFSYTVARYTPLKRTTATSATSKNGTAGSRGSGSGGSGGRGGGGGGGGGGMEEKPGSTRIIWILPEGTPVKQNEVVCELDSAAFRDEQKAQQIRWLQAKSYVEQAAALLAVNEITLREYKEGILPQDLQLIRQYVQTCEIDRDRARQNVEWSRGVRDKGLRTSSQLRADELALQQAEFVLSEAQGMLTRLEKYTGPKILKTLEAKLASILTDKLAQDASFALEEERLNRLNKNIEACTLKAPRDGVVVYVNQSNGWGRVESVIQEGVTVRQDQPIFQLPDPKRMRIKARINETKVSLLKVGQECLVRMDAYPDRPLRGKVTDVTAISSPVNGPFSDVRVYFALVSIEEGFNELRPGLSSEVTFLHDRRSDVDRIPLAAVRQVGGSSYVAVPARDVESKDKQAYRWQKVDLGLSDSDYVEVLSGVREGDRVVADPLSLEAPDPNKVDAPTSRIASAAP